MDDAAAKQQPKRTVRLAILLPVLTILILAILYPVWSLSTKRIGVTVHSHYGDYTWAELAEISQAITSAQTKEEALEIAKFYNICRKEGTFYSNRSKEVELSDGRIVHAMIVGILHDDKSDGSGKAGLTFAFTDAIDEYHINSAATNYGGWEKSEMRSHLRLSTLPMLPADLRASIVEVAKRTNNVGALFEENQNSVRWLVPAGSFTSTTNDILWLFSAQELSGGKTQDSLDTSQQWTARDESFWSVLATEGEQYALFREQQVRWNGQNKILVRPNAVFGFDATYRYWWLRTPRPTNSAEFFNLSTVGSFATGQEANYVYGIAPGFCI